ncbi:MAG TPA: MmcQ/YjbR family DNA-binding protein [Candidatus Margulisiibacteriota bacterium]|nr:MmcQ/YjbR family DNA-binding protein [Candidatus Margulisiibacteriota bacterium]
MAHPHMEYDPEGPIKRLREICLALPEATEKEAWGECTFRVGGKMFAMTDNHHHGSEHCSVWVKAPPMVQEILVGADPQRFFKPPYVGHKGWVGVRLDVKNVDWKELAGILEDGYQMSAPKRLAKLRSSAATASAPAAEKGRAKRPKARRY